MDIKQKAEMDGLRGGEVKVKIPNFPNFLISAVQLAEKHQQKMQY